MQTRLPIAASTTSFLFFNTLKSNANLNELQRNPFSTMIWRICLLWGDSFSSLLSITELRTQKLITFVYEFRDLTYSMKKLGKFLLIPCSFQAVLEGVGVGDESATALAATITWLLRHGTGMCGQIVFTWLQGSDLDHNCKKWRLFADIMNDSAILIELTAPFWTTSCVQVRLFASFL